MTGFLGLLIFVAFWLVSIAVVGAVFNWFALLALLPLAAVAIIVFAACALMRGGR